MPNSMHITLYGGCSTPRVSDHTKESAQTATVDNLNHLIKLVNNPNFEAMALTAVVKSSNEVRVCEITTNPTPEADSLYSTYRGDTYWRHTLPESADRAYEGIADAIALFDAETDDGNGHHVDIGTSPIGTFVINEPDEEDEDQDD